MQATLRLHDVAHGVIGFLPHAGTGTKAGFRRLDILIRRRAHPATP